MQHDTYGARKLSDLTISLKHFLAVYFLWIKRKWSTNDHRMLFTETIISKPHHDINKRLLFSVATTVTVRLTCSQNRKLKTKTSRFWRLLPVIKYIQLINQGTGDEKTKGRGHDARNLFWTLQAKQRKHWLTVEHVFETAIHTGSPEDA